MGIQFHFCTYNHKHKRTHTGRGRKYANANVSDTREKKTFDGKDKTSREVNAVYTPSIWKVDKKRDETVTLIALNTKKENKLPKIYHEMIKGIYWTNVIKTDNILNHK